MGFRVGQKVVDISGAIAKVTFVDPDRKKVAIRIIESEGMSAMREGQEYSVPERQLQAYSSGTAEKIQRKRGWIKFKKKK